MSLIKIEDCLLLIIDFQERLVASLKDSSIIEKAVKLVKTANLLDIPIIYSEQYPKGLGKTVNEISSVLPSKAIKFEKTSFSLLNENNFLETLKSYNKKQVIICGIEAHICVYQTAVELIKAGFDVTVAKDICASRKDCEFEFGVGFNLMNSAGAHVSCLEIILFELLRGANHPKFKDIQALIK